MHSQKLNILIINIFYILVNSFSFAQVDNSKLDSVEVNKIHIIDLLFVNSYGLGYNIYSNNKSEIRLLLDLYGEGRFEDEERTQTDTRDDQIVKRDHKNENNTEFNALRITAQYLYDFYKNDFGELFFGGGPLIGYSWNNYSYSNSDNEYEYLNQNYKNTYSLGLTGLIGIRGKLNNSISVFAQLQILGQYSWRKIEVEMESYDYSSPITRIDKTEENFDITNWEYSVRYASIGIRFSI
ncbi:MAG: hypothetical protein H6690_00275 [Erysipelotrichaceae bacterium]|nr:hypothetical protein [Erysipelotrichaceae bacterium]